MSGSLESDADDSPRMRMRAPPPTVPFDAIIVTPAVRPFSTSCMEVIGCSSTSLEASILAMEFPSSRVSVCPVAVVTTASSW